MAAYDRRADASSDHPRRLDELGVAYLSDLARCVADSSRKRARIFARIASELTTMYSSEVCARSPTGPIPSMVGVNREVVLPSVAGARVDIDDFFKKPQLVRGGAVNVVAELIHASCHGITFRDPGH